MRFASCFFTPPCLAINVVVISRLQAKEILRGLFLQNRAHSSLQKGEKNKFPSVLEAKGFLNLSWLISALHPVGERRPVPHQYLLGASCSKV